MSRFRSLVDRWIGAARSADPLAVDPTTGLRGAVVVTGGSEGIGLAIARRFAADGHHVVLVARDERRLADAVRTLRAERATHAVTFAALDVTADDAAETLARSLADQSLYCDILVNNAGVGFGGRFDQMSAETLDGLVTLNVTALARLTRAVLPEMLARRSGGVINVASFGGLVPGPYQAAYYASKAFVISLTQAIAWEIRGGGVRMCVVAPGPVETLFHARMHAETAYYRWLMPSATPEHVARAAVRGFWGGQTLVKPSILYRGMAVFLRLAPSKLQAAVVGWLLKPRGAQT